jgi:dienelactone hydrolase
VTGGRRTSSWALVVLALLGAAPREAGAAPRTPAPRTESLTIRGHAQSLHVYGKRGGPAAIVSSGDGGWVHLGPEVAAFLAAEGYFVVGFDAKAYLSGFTTSSGTLTVEDVPRDYAALVDYAASGATGRPLLVGVSEGAGLSVLAATAPEIQARIGGVIALGLPEKNELGWRWRDSIIYLTKKAPREPLFSARAIVPNVAPLPLAALASTHDEFAPLAEVRAIMDAAREPKRLWVIEAANHNFSDNQPELQRRLAEAIAWIEATRSGQ